MLMRENKGLFSFPFDSAHVKHGVWTWPKREISEIEKGNLIKIFTENTDPNTYRRLSEVKHEVLTSSWNNQ